MNHDPVRATMLGLPGVAVLWVVTVAAFGVFGWRVSQLVGVLRRARPENRCDQLGQRSAFAKTSSSTPPVQRTRHWPAAPGDLLGLRALRGVLRLSLMRGLLPF